VSRASELTLFLSNHDQRASRHVIHPIVGRTNFVYDAKGSLEKIRGEAIAFCVKDCEDITIRNVRIDSERPCLTEARVLGFGAGTTRVTIDRELYPFVIEGGRMLMTGSGWTNAVHKARLFDGRTGEHLPEVGDIAFDGAACELADGTVEFQKDFSPFGVGLKEGDVIVLRPRLRDFPAIAVLNSRNVVLEDVVIHDAKGMGLIAQNSENVTWRGTKPASSRTSGVFPRPGAFASTHADASHFSNVKGLVRVENCCFEGMMDDAINIHSTCLAVTNIIGKRTLACRYAHPQSIGLDLFRAGESLRFLCGRTMKTGPEMTVAAVRSFGPDAVEVTLDADAPTEWGIGDAVENADRQPSAIFSGNIVRNNRARGACFATPHPVLVESNLFERVTGTALPFAGDARFWYESGACRDVTIRGNVFSNCLTCARWHGRSHGVVTISPNVADFEDVRRGYHRNFRIERNVFAGLDAPLLYAAAAEGIVFGGNEISYGSEYRGHELPPYVFHACCGVEVNGYQVAGETAVWTAPRTEEFIDDGWRIRRDSHAGMVSAYKRFSMPVESVGQMVFLDTVGTNASASAILNGIPVGCFHAGSRRINLTPALYALGTENVLVVRGDDRVCDMDELVRSVHLVCTSPIHIGVGGVRISTESRADGVVRVMAKADVCTLPWIKPEIAHHVMGEESLDIRHHRPDAQYVLETVVSVGGKPVDRVETRFDLKRGKR